MTSRDDCSNAANSKDPASKDLTCGNKVRS